MIEEYQSRLILFSVLVLFLGSFTVLVGSTSVKETFSQANEPLSQGDIPHDPSVIPSQQSSAPDTKLLENLGLSAVYQSVEREIARIMNLAYQSMNLTNSFGTLPLSNLTTDMQQQFRGIPGDHDTDRRNEAKRLLASNPYLWFIGMTLPNGDTYFSEPFFSSQADSSKSNYGYRDHINGAIDSKSPYLSNVIISASTGQPLVVLASPVFSGKEANKTLIGVLALGLDLKQFDELLKSESDGKNETRLLILDGNGTKISDSQSNATGLESFKHLQSFENANNGELGSIIEGIDGKNMTIAYAPLKFAQSKWILLSISGKN